MGAIMEAVAEIQITENAARQIKTLLDDSEDNKGKALRVYIEAGGCSGMQYGMTFDEKKADDHVYSQNGVEVIMDSQSLDYLKGSMIDYVDSIQGSGFRIQNPNAKTSCGCGKSFQ
jgi:iron-sulfur cluster assembly accessory protein